MSKWIKLENLEQTQERHVLFTNNMLGKNNDGDMTNIWIGRIYKDNSGEFCSLTGSIFHTIKVQGITHFMFLPKPLKEVNK